MRLGLCFAQGVGYGMFGPGVTQGLSGFMTGLISALRNWRERNQVLRELRHQTVIKRERDRFAVRDVLEEALSVADLDDAAKAGRLFDKAFHLDQRAASESPLALRLLLKLKRYDDAEAIMRAGQKRHPGDIGYLEGLATVADTRGDLDRAIELFAELRKRSPRHARGYFLGAGVLARKGMVREAEELARRSMKLFPDEVAGYLEYARLAVRSEDWNAAIERWTIMQEHFPNWAFGFSGAAEAMMKLGRYDEGEALLVSVRSRFPMESAMATLYAQIAQDRGDYVEATARWKRRVDRFPLERHAYTTAATALEAMGDIDGAAEMLRAGTARFDDNRVFLRVLTELCGRHSRYGAEADAWAALRKRYPDDTDGWSRGALALRRAGRAEEADALIATSQVYRSSTAQSA
jgi:tetratricopeptide (TPR) repeat protein